MKNKKLSIVLFLLVVISCSKKDVASEQDKTQSSALKEFNIKLNFLDTKNQDLLNSSIPNYYPKKDIKVYFLNNGEKELVTDADGNTEAASYLHKEEVPKILELSTSYHVDTIIGKKDGFEVGRSITYLELNKSTVDTIVSEWNRKTGYFVVQKIWYNGDYHKLNGEPYQVKKDVN